MKFIELTRVPFGPILINPELVAAIAPAASDPFQGHYNGQAYGCCIHVANESIRVKESALEVIHKLSEARSMDLPKPVVPTLTDVLEASRLGSAEDFPDPAAVDYDFGELPKPSKKGKKKK